MTSVCVITAACLWKQWKIEEQSLCGWMKRERRGSPAGRHFCDVVSPDDAAERTFNVLLFAPATKRRGESTSGRVVPVGRRCTRNLASFLVPPAYTL